MASPEVGGRKRRDEQLLVLPVVRLRGLDLAPTHGRQLTRLRLDDLTPGDVLNGLEEDEERKSNINIENEYKI